MQPITKHRIWRSLTLTGFRARLLAVVAIAALATTACDVHGVSDPGIPQSISVAPNATLIPGATQQMVAEARDADGRVVTITPTWTVVAGGGTISSTGLFTAGTTTGAFANTVRATTGDLAATASITVIAGPLATIVVTPTPVTLAVSTTQQFIAVGKDASGNIVQLHGSWSVVTGGGSINAAGVFTAGTTTGTYANTVQMSDGSVRGFATVIVTAGPLATITVTPNPATLIVGAKQQFVATGKDASGNVIPIASTWSVVASGGTIDGGGLFTAGTTPGTYANTVKATSGTISGTATVTVTAGPLAIITVTPNPIALLAGATQQYVAVGRDADGNNVPFTGAWSVVAGGGGISSTGLFQAGTVAGVYLNTVQASEGAIKGFATVTVTTGALASITVTPNPDTLAAGGTRQFTAVGRDANGNVFALTPVWSVIANGGTITSTGLFTAGSQIGRFDNTIQATSGTISGTATVVVISGALTTITVTPNPVTLAVSTTQQFTAVGKDASGNVVTFVPTWSVVNTGGSIGSSGLFTAGGLPGTYTNTVQASNNTIKGFATVTVIPGPLASITVTPNPDTLAVNGTRQFVAVGKDANGNIMIIAPTWAVIANGGTITSTGLFTAGNQAAKFDNTIRATSGTISGTATVVVIVGPLATITVTPNPATLITNTAQQFTAVGKDVGGNVVAITPTWSVVNNGGTIASSGLFTAGGVLGTYTNTVQATHNTISGFATVIVTSPPPPPPPPPSHPLGAAANFGIISGAAIRCMVSGGVSGASSVASIGSSNATYVGWPPGGPCTLDGAIATAGDIVTAQNALTAAYNAKSAGPCIDLTAHQLDLGFYDGSDVTHTLPPGTYCFPGTTAALVNNAVLKLTGDANATWTFQVGTALTVGTDARVDMAGGAIPDNVYWVTGAAATLGTNSQFKGNILAQSAITLNAGALLNGRALARTAGVDMIEGAASIVKP